MKAIGNIVWLVVGGFLVALVYYLVGLLMCITIIGIPFGVQLFKLGTFAMWPFGRELVNGPGEPGCLSTVMNHLVSGLIFCITIVGIPWGLQHFKMIIPSIFPFGKIIRSC